MEGVSEPPQFFSRAELGGGFRTLERLLLDERVPVVNVHGAPGSGKSSFVRAFVDRRRSAFPGGVVWLIAHGDLDHAGLVQLPTDAQTLVVLDEVDLANVSSLRDELAWLRQHRPLTQAVTISRLNVSVGRDTAPASRCRRCRSARSWHSSPTVRSLTIEVALNGLRDFSRATHPRSQKPHSGSPRECRSSGSSNGSSGDVVVARDSQGAELPLGSAGRERIDAAVDEISDELIRELAVHPDRLYELNPRRFEELVAELYRRRGFEATLTPASGDEGVDVYVVSNDELGRTLWVVQAKRYAANRKVGAGVVRELLGTVYAKNASAGIVVTTSFFEPGAVRVEQEFEYRIALRDYLSLQDMLRW